MRYSCRRGCADEGRKTSRKNCLRSVPTDGRTAEFGFSFDSFDLTAVLSVVYSSIRGIARRESKFDWYWPVGVHQLQSNFDDMHFHVDSDGPIRKLEIRRGCRAGDPIDNDR